jgi:hypothetical protein
MYQAFLQEQLRRIDLALKLNEEIQSELKSKSSKRYQAKSTTTARVESSKEVKELIKRGVKESESGRGGDGGGGGGGGRPRHNILYIALTPTPYFVDPLGHRPPDNEDARHMRVLINNLPRYVQPKKWKASEMRHLAQAVHQQSQQVLVNQLFERYRRPDSGSLEDFNREMARVRTMSEYELETYVNGIDWELLAKTCLPHRTAEECRLKWLRHLSPLINREMWSKEEDERLLQLAQQYGATQWELIAQQLGTRRTPAQCFTRFQRSLNRQIMKSKWTEEEDRILIDAIKKYGEKNWQQGILILSFIHFIHSFIHSLIH